MVPDTIISYAMRILLAVLLLAFAAPVFSQQDVEAARRTVAAIETALKQRPNDGTLWFYLSRYQAEAGDRQASIAALEKVLELGEGFLPPRDGFEKVWDDPEFKAVRAKLEAKLPRLDFAPRAYELEDRTLIPEGIAYDIPSHSLFIGSIAQRKVLRIADQGSVSVFAAGADLDAILGIAVDSPRRILYAVSTSALTAEGEKRRRNAVVAFDIDSRRFLQRYDVPAATQLNDVTVAPGGRVFASDSGSGAVYEIAVKGPGPSREVSPPGQVRGSNGIAASPDAKRLYIAHSTGLAALDIATGTLTRVANDTRETVAAIDGLYEWQGQYIGVQNVTTPGRVILITLSRDGNTVTRVQTLLSHHHNALDEPTTGALSDRGFYLLAATGVAHFNAQGQIERADTVPNPTILRLPLPR
jgi:tetratricopeptide (TPR) repeat protein